MYTIAKCPCFIFHFAVSKFKQSAKHDLMKNVLYQRYITISDIYPPSNM